MQSFDDFPTTFVLFWVAHRNTGAPSHPSEPPKWHNRC
jgi:hypothetical protein